MDHLNEDTNGMADTFVDATKRWKIKMVKMCRENRKAHR